MASLQLNQRDNFKIYVACLSSYNAGILHGRWIDAEQDAEGIQSDVDKLLAESTEEPAEEWAIHDFDLGGAHIDEWERFETVATLARLLREHGEVAAAVWNDMGNLEDTINKLEEDYAGSFDEVSDWAYEFMHDTMEIPGYLDHYIDYERFGRDMELGGDINAYRVDGEFHIFWAR